MLERGRSLNFSHNPPRRRVFQLAYFFFKNFRMFIGGGTVIIRLKQSCFFNRCALYTLNLKQRALAQQGCHRHHSPDWGSRRSRASLRMFCRNGARFR